MTQSEVQTDKEVESKTDNNNPTSSIKSIDKASLISLILGVVCIFFPYNAIPTLGAFIAGAIGFNNTRKNKKKGRWMAIVGLVLGLGFFAYAFIYSAIQGYQATQ